MPFAHLLVNVPLIGCVIYQTGVLGPSGAAVVSHLALRMQAKTAEHERVST